MSYIESNKRSIIKCATYRIVGTLITIAIAFILTGNGSLSLGLGLFDFFMKLISYYLHERIWNIIPYGKTIMDKDKSLNDTKHS